MRRMEAARLFGGAGNNTIDASLFQGTVNIYGAAGDDLLIGSSSLSALIGDDGNDRLYSGRGNTTLRGGRGDDLLVGSYGDDKLYGDDGRDVLMGGFGADFLYGGNNDDLLIGPVANALVSLNEPLARDAILSTWRAAEDYAAKVQKLSCSEGVGPDNSVKLQMGVTVLDDFAVDTYYGNAGTDWFLINQETELLKVLDREGIEQL